MSTGCFFNDYASEILQHIALAFEVIAVLLVWSDYGKRESDISRKGRATMVTGLPVPHEKRTTELSIAFFIGAVAICMETYQLLTQYIACS